MKHAALLLATTFLSLGLQAKEQDSRILHVECVGNLIHSGLQGNIADVTTLDISYGTAHIASKYAHSYAGSFECSCHTSHVTWFANKESVNIRGFLSCASQPRIPRLDNPINLNIELDMQQNSIITSDGRILRCRNNSL